MSLTRRNIIAFILILFAAVCWTFGQQMLDTNIEEDISNTTYPATEATIHPTTVETVYPNEDWTIPTNTTTAASESTSGLQSPFHFTVLCSRLTVKV